MSIPQQLNAMTVENLRSKGRMFEFGEHPLLAASGLSI
jgi:hypothetical protein